jgi:hypothetical protein
MSAATFLLLAFRMHKLAFWPLFAGPVDRMRFFVRTRRSAQAADIAEFLRVVHASSLSGQWKAMPLRWIIHIFPFAANSAA